MLSTGVPLGLTRAAAWARLVFCDTSRNGPPFWPQRRKRSRRSIERPARRGGSERARPAVPSVNVALASSEAQPDVVLDTRCHPRRSRSMDHDAPCCPDCVGAAGHYLCTGDLLPGASAAMMSTGSCWRPSKRHAPNCCSNCGLEMGVCRTSWKRVSCAQRDARAAQGAA